MEWMVLSNKAHVAPLPEADGSLTWLLNYDTYIL